MPPASSPVLPLRRPTRRAAPLALAPLALAALTAACQSWQPEPLPPSATGAGEAGLGHVRATRTDGSQIELVAARLERDTLRGALLGYRGAEGTVAVPADSLRRLEVRRVSRGRTTALGLGAGALLAVLAVVLTSDGDDYSWR